MGCSSSKSSAQKSFKEIHSKVLNMTTPHDIAIHKKLAPLMDL